MTVLTDFSLAIETSSRVGSVALVSGRELLAEKAFAHGLQHASELLPLIDNLLSNHNLTPTDLRTIFLSIGPGSFTGLRIGVTLAKTLAFSLGVKIVAVPTVRVLAANAPAEARNLLIVLDAKRQQVFTARFSRGSDQEPWQEQEPAHLDWLHAAIARSPRPVHLLGEGIPYHREFIGDEAEVVVTAEELWRPRAAAVAALGVELAGRGEFAEAQCLSPLYVRKPEAEEKWELLHGRGGDGGGGTGRG